MKRKVVSLISILSLSIVSVAQGEGAVALGAAQAKILAQGVKAAQKGQYKRALKLYEAALRHGDAKSIHLEAGRAHAALGACAAAEASFQRALGAPSAMPSEALEDAVEEARAGLREVCPSALSVECTPADMVLSIDGQRLACGQRVRLKPGPHEVVGHAYGGQVSQTVELRPKASVKLKLEIEAPSMNFREATDEEKALHPK